MTTEMKSPQKWILLSAQFLSRLGSYAGLRGLYVFSRYFEQFWLLNSQDMGFLLGASEFAAFPSVFVGPLGDKYGYGWITFATQILTATSVFLLVVNPPVFWYLFLFRSVFSFLLNVLSMMIQGSAMKYIASDSNRGRITAVLELAWSLSLLIVIPVLGLLYEISGPNSMHITIGIILLLPAFVILGLTPSENEKHPEQEENTEGILASVIRVSLLPGKPFYYNLSDFLFNIAHNALLTSFTYWIVDFYHLSPSEIGQSTMLLGFAELTGASLVALVSDKIGLKRSLYLSSLLFSILALIHTWCTSISLQAGLGSLWILFVFGELSFITRIAYAEAMVQEKDVTTYLGIFFIAQFTGRCVGAMLADPLWKSPGMHKSIGVLSFVLGTISSWMIYRLPESKPAIIMNLE